MIACIGAASERCCVFHLTERPINLAECVHSTLICSRSTLMDLKVGL